MEFVNTFTLIDMLGTFGSGNSPAASTADQTGQVREPDRVSVDFASRVRPSDGTDRSVQVEAACCGLRCAAASFWVQCAAASRPPAGSETTRNGSRSRNGIELYTRPHGRITPVAATCVVAHESGYTDDEYEQWKARIPRSTGRRVATGFLGLQRIGQVAGQTMYAFYSIAIGMAALFELGRRPRRSLGTLSSCKLGWHRGVHPAPQWGSGCAGGDGDRYGVPVRLS